jgi:hypothetical protein
MADITAKYVRFVAPAPCVTNFMASNGSQRKLTALPVDVIKRLIDQGAKVAEVKEILDEDDNVVGYEDVVLDDSNYNVDNECIAVPEDATVTADIDKEVADKHAAEWEAHMAEIGEAIKKEQDEKQEEFFPTDVVEGGGEGATGGPEPGTGPIIPPPAGPTMEEEGGSL